MKKIPYFMALIAMPVLAGCAAASSSGSSLSGIAREKAFVREVAVGMEYLSSKQYVSRWGKKPSLSVYGGTIEDNSYIRSLVDELNEILKPARFGLKYLDPNDPDADIKVIFAPEREFPEIAQMRMFSYVRGNRGYAYTWYSLPGHEINRAVVLIDSGLKGKQRHHFIREEITQSLGPGSDSPLYKDSVFYSKGSNGGSTTTYSELDKKLLFFFYKYLRPGDYYTDVENKIEKHWAEI